MPAVAVLLCCCVRGVVWSLLSSLVEWSVVVLAWVTGSLVC